MVYDILRKEIKKDNRNIALEVNNFNYYYIPYEFKTISGSNYKIF